MPASTVPWILACCTTAQLQWFEGGGWSGWCLEAALRREKTVFLLSAQAGAVLGCAQVWRSQLASPPGAPLVRTQPVWKGSTGVLHLALSNLDLEVAEGQSACELWG